MGTVTISKEEYDELCKNQDILDVLYAAGVDNWAWYDEAMQSLNNEVEF